MLGDGIAGSGFWFTIEALTVEYDYRVVITMQTPKSNCAFIQGLLGDNVGTTQPPPVNY